MKKRIFSGAQPTGNLHIGNYLGALKNWVSLQSEFESFYCIVNLHAITLPQDPEALRRNTLDLARIYLAAGINPDVSTIFVQSDVPEHAELAWVLNCISRMGELERMTQFKDKGRGNAARTSVGLFTYPVLMASDILLYRTNLVPVGRDQKQHLELTRDLAQRFNRDFGEVFEVPEPYIPPIGASIMSLKDPAKKMSKSDPNPNASIFLLDNEELILKKVRKAVTDSGTEIRFDNDRPAITNLLTIYRLLTGLKADECESKFEGSGYGEFKSGLGEIIVEYLRPFQQRFREIGDGDLEKILERGAERARSVASETLKRVYYKMGVR